MPMSVGKGQGELNAGEESVYGFGQGPREGGLAHAGDILNQHMSAGHERQDDLLNLLFFPLDDAGKIVAGLFHQAVNFGNIRIHAG